MATQRMDHFVRGLFETIVAATLLFPAGCASLSASRELSAAGIELEVPGVAQQQAFECGIASIEALAAYHGVALQPGARAEIARLAAHEGGASGRELAETLESAGLEVFLFRGRLDDSSPTGLQHHLAAGRPLVVALAAGQRHHFVLLSGYDPETRDVVVLDPAQGRLVLTERRFTECWERADRLTLLALPRAPGDRPRPESERSP